MKTATINRIIIYSVVSAGLIHLYLAPIHSEHALAHGIFFVVSGIVELVWAFLFTRKKTETMYYAGIMITGGLIVLWAITRVLPAPFEHEIGVIDLSGILCKLMELVGLVGLLVVAARGKIPGISGRTFARLVSEAVLVSMFIGFGAYMAGHDFEPMFPFLAGQHDEQTQ